MNEAAEPHAMAGTRRWWWAAVVAVLAGIVVYAVMHEAGKAPAPGAASAPGDASAPGGHIGHEMGHVERPPMSADDERYAHALWQVHDKVRASAVKMTFAGLAYKMGDTDKAVMRDKVLPLIAVFDAAHASAEAIQVPAGMRALHVDYLKAVSLYQKAAREMTSSLKKDDGHLLVAHGYSEQASTLLLKVGDTLWPGEYKPN